jgi:hypothetical protein
MTEVDLSNKGLQTAGAIIVAAWISHRYKGSGIIALANAVPYMRLTSLNLSSNDIGAHWDEEQEMMVGTPEGAFVVVIASCSHVVFYVGPVAITDAIKDMGGLSSLNLASNFLCGIDGDGEGTFDASGDACFHHHTQLTLTRACPHRHYSPC